MIAPLAPLLLLALLLLAPASASPKRAAKKAAAAGALTGMVIKLTDANFDRETAAGTPALLFSVGAAWCPHCVALAPALDALARELAQAGQGGRRRAEGEDDEDGDDPAAAVAAAAGGKRSLSSSSAEGGGGPVRVGRVDGPSNRVLMMRLGVKGFPSIYLVRDGRAWVYRGRGPRTAEALREFALEGWRVAEPLPWSKSPVSPLGRALGVALSLPAAAGAWFSSMREEGGWSELQLIALAMAVPVVAGAAVICALDGVHTRRARAAAAAAWRHEHGE